MFSVLDIRKLIALAVLLTIALTGLSGVAAAQDGDPYIVDDAYLIDSGDEDPEVVPGGGVAFDAPVVSTSSGKFLKAKKAFNGDFETFLKAKKAFGTDGSEGENKAAATRVRKAFLKAKKAFHENRKDIEDIKKGDEDPVEDVPSFFDDDA